MKKNEKYFVCDKEGYLVFNQTHDTQSIQTVKTHLHATKNGYFEDMLKEIEERLSDHHIGSELRLIGRLIISSHVHRAQGKGKLPLPDGASIEHLIDFYANELPSLLTR